MNHAVFLDRDGVIIENVDTYVRSWEDAHILPGAIDALVRLSATSYRLVVVTNQSAVGRGIIPLAAAHSINQRLVDMVRSAGGRIDGVFLCPHAPQENCTCRKPQPGLLLQAANQLNLDLQRSILIGDALSDIQAGQRAGLRTTILVRTGRGAAQLHLPAAQALAPFLVYDRLLDVCDALLSRNIIPPEDPQV